MRIRITLEYSDCHFAEKGHLFYSLRISMEHMWLFSPTIPVLALLHMWQKNLLYFLSPLTLRTFIWLLKLAVDPHTLWQNWHKLPVGCCWRTFAKQDFDSLQSWDLIWLTSPVLDWQTLLQCYKYVQAVKGLGPRSSLPSKVLISDGSIQFSMLQMFSSFHRSQDFIYIYIYIYK